MKIFVKPNPFWEIVLWILLAISVWTISSIMFSKINPDEKLIVIIVVGLLTGLLVSMLIFLVGLPIYWLIEELNDAYRQSYPKKPKKQRSNTKDQIQTIQDESNYEVNKYKNKLKSIL